MAAILAFFTVLGAIGTLATVPFMYLEYQERKGRRLPGGKPPEALERLPEWWPKPITSERAELTWRAMMAYLFGSIGALFFLLSRRVVVRFHALQSLSLDVTALLLVIGLALLAAAGEGIAGMASPHGRLVQAVYERSAFSVLLGSLGIRLAIVIQILRGKPGRMPLLWIACARAAESYRR